MIDESTKAKILEYYIFKGDCIDDDFKRNMQYFNNNKFKYDVDFVRCWRSFVIRSFYYEMMHEFLNYLELSP